MSRRRFTGKRAVWLGMLGTPVLLVAAVVVLGVAAGSAGPSTSATTAASAAPAATGQVVSGPVSHVTAFGAGTQTMAQLKAYWTPERMANAQPKVYAAEPSSASGTHGSVQTIPQSSAPMNFIKMTADGGVETASAPVPSSPQALTEPYHTQIPFTQFQYFARYLPSVLGGGPNVSVSTQHKMFFSQGGGNFVCSSSTIGMDGVWTAGHCVHDGVSGPSAGFSTNVMFCPAYDNGINATAGCWGADELWVWCPEFCSGGDGDYDFGGADPTDIPIVGPQGGNIGTFSGILGLAYTATDAQASPNFNWMAFGYPQGPPFGGGKIEVATSSLGYLDHWTPGGLASLSMGSNLTGGSSGGPWLISFGRPSQPGGGTPPGFPCCNFVNGHNDWVHLPGGGIPFEMNSPSYNCRAFDMFRAVNDLAPAACP